MYPPPNIQPDMLAFLHEQHGNYTTELGRTHQELSKLYKNLARVERVLAEQALGRKEKRRIFWARSLTNDAVRTLEAQQAGLHEYLRQCTDLIASCERSTYHLPSTPWTAHLPSSPFASSAPSSPFSPYSPVARNPWSAALPRPCASACTYEGPRHWDLSMLRERRRSSVNASSADSGFYEPPMYGQPFGLDHEDFHDPDHVYAHEIMPADTYDSTAEATASAASSGGFATSEPDDVPELSMPPSVSAHAGAEAKRPSINKHKRCRSETAVQQMDSRHTVSKTQQRGTSVGPASSTGRRSSDMQERYVDVRSKPIRNL